jgi:hypothetical protein
LSKDKQAELISSVVGQLQPFSREAMALTTCNAKIMESEGADSFDFNSSVRTLEIKKLPTTSFQAVTLAVPCSSVPRKPMNTQISVKQEQMDPIVLSSSDGEESSRKTKKRPAPLSQSPTKRHLTSSPSFSSSSMPEDLTLHQIRVFIQGKESELDQLREMENKALQQEQLKSAQAQEMRNILSAILKEHQIPSVSSCVVKIMSNGFVRVHDIPLLDRTTVKEIFPNFSIADVCKVVKSFELYQPRINDENVMEE